MRVKLSVFVLLCSICFSVNAATILDTGQGVSDLPGTSLLASQSLAVPFSLGQSYTINELYGWIFPFVSGDLTLSIYANDGFDSFENKSLPGTLLSSSSFLVESSDQASWIGLDNLSIPLAQGDYWLAFEVLNSAFDGTMSLGVTNPVPYAVRSTLINGEPGWLVIDNIPIGSFESDDIGARVIASAVPIPAAVWLFGSGLIGLVGFPKRKKA